MAYEVDSGTLSSSLHSSGSLALNSAVISRILATVGVTVNIDQLSVTSDSTLTVPAGTQIGYFHTSDTTINSITIDNPPPVIVLQSSAGVEVLVNTGTNSAGNPIYVIVGSAGNDHIVVSGTTDTAISLGTGDNTVVGGGGDDTFYYNGSGNDTIDGGGGNDSIVFTGTTTSDFHISVQTVASGTSALVAQASTTDHVILTNNVSGDTIDLTGVQYVQFDNDALIVANSTVEAGVASLYHAAFGRTGEAGGVGFWFDHATEGLSLHDIAVGFTQSAEFAHDASLSNADFITQLYLNTFNRTPDTGGMAYWTQQLANGATRADLLTSFATVAALNESGVIHTEATVVGTVIIVDHIV
jgi:Ca2+-binding RTX toxin-like protein